VVSSFSWVGSAFAMASSTAAGLSGLDAMMRVARSSVCNRSCLGRFDGLL
jgi:hypothetical protein